MVLPEAFVFCTFTTATLATGSALISGLLSLKSISRALVLQVDTSEIPIDPHRTILRSEIISTTPSTKKIIHRFLATPHHPIEFELVTESSLDPDVHSALDMFDNILEQYVVDFKRITPSPLSVLPSSSSPSSSSQNKDGDYILVNEGTNQVRTQAKDDTFQSHQDPSVRQSACEDELVVIDLDVEWTREDGSLQKVTPPLDQETWVTKSASVVSDTISMGTDLLLTTMTAASSYYINHSDPSPHHSGPSGSSDVLDTASSTTTAAVQHKYPEDSQPPQALVFLRSPQTRQGLSIVHDISTKAVKVSSKTVELVDDVVKQVMGATDHPSQSSSPVPSLSPSARPLSPQSGTLIPLPSTSGVQPRAQISTEERLLASADLILSTLDDSARRVFNVGTEELGKVVGHKYGPEAAHSSLMLAGTAKNIGSFFADIGGIGQRALVKGVRTAFVKARVLERFAEQLTPATVVDEQLVESKKEK